MGTVSWILIILVRKFYWDEYNADFLRNFHAPVITQLFDNSIIASQIQISEETINKKIVWVTKERRLIGDHNF